MKKQAIKLNSDNFQNEYVSQDIYKEITLQMSTGDFHTHTHKKVRVDEWTPVIIDFCNVTGEPIFDTNCVMSDE